MSPRRALAGLIVLAALLVPSLAVAADVKALPVLKGAQVWFAEDHTVPMIALTASFPAGSAYDPPTKAGMASFAAALLDEGAGNLDGAAFQMALANHAIKLEVEPDRDSMTVTLITLTSSAKEAFRLLAMALAHPRFDADAVARTRVQMLQDIEEERDDPESVAETGFYSLYFGPYAYGHRIDGDPRGLNAITPEDLRVFARTHWVRGGLKISVAGDADAAMVTTLVRTAFAGLPVRPPVLPPPPDRVGAAGRHVLPMDEPQAAIFFGLPGLLRSDPDYLAGVIADYILGGGETSRLYDEVRAKRGLTYDISTDLVSYRRAGIFLGEVSTRRDAVDKTIAVVRETMRKFAADGPTSQEVADAKTYLNGSFPLTFASNADTAAQLNQFQQDGLPLDYLDRRAGLIDAVTVDDVRRVASRLCDPAKMTVVVAGPDSQKKRSSAP